MGSDWAQVEINEPINEIWYRIKRNGSDYVAYYSLDGEKYHQVRMFCLNPEVDEIKAGVYACSPQRDDFECVLEQLEIK